MRAGDYVLFYQSKHYTFVTNILGTLRNADLSRSLWGSDDEGQTWELVFFLSKPKQIAVPIADADGYLLSSPYLGMFAVSGERLTKIKDDFGDVGGFVAAKIDTAAAPFYLLLRSNETSAWDDREARSYHFGRTVPNYKKIVPGAMVLVDRKTSAGVSLIGAGEIGTVRAEPGEDDKFVASYRAYRAFGEPRPITEAQLALIRSEPNYNAQHAIRPLSRDTYYGLLGEKVSMHPPGPSIEEFAAAIYWSAEDTRRLVAFFDRSSQIILAGPPGTGKSHIANELADFVSERNGDVIERIQFHPSFQYEDFIEGIRPILVSERNNDDKALRYRIKDGVLKRLVDAAIKNRDQIHVLIIDEINRANVSKVFGELLYSLEYRDPKFAVTLPYSDRRFFVPPNIKIIGTMNTADRSIALIDAAFRRRFHQFTMKPDLDVIRRWHAENTTFELGNSAAGRLGRLNEALLGVLADEGRLIGHSFFLREDLEIVGFESVWTEDLEPIIREHLYNSENDVARCKSAFLSG